MEKSIAAFYVEEVRFQISGAGGRVPPKPHFTSKAAVRKGSLFRSRFAMEGKPQSEASADAIAVATPKAVDKQMCIWQFAHVHLQGIFFYHKKIPSVCFAKANIHPKECSCTDKVFRLPQQAAKGVAFGNYKPFKRLVPNFNFGHFFLSSEFLDRLRLWKNP